MTDISWAFLLLALACALGNWYAVAGVDKPRLIYVFKPATMVFLIALAISLSGVDGHRRAWFVAALVLSLAGDIFLMLPNTNLFIGGLGSFFLSHVLYVVGFLSTHVSFGSVVPYWGVLLVVGGIVGAKVISGARASGHEELAAPIVGYILILTLMAACGLAAKNAPAAAGGLAFLASDSLLSWDRFVKPIPNGHLAVMTTYHLAQGLLVISLLARFN